MPIRNPLPVRRPRIVRFASTDALNWHLHRETLRQALVDAALNQLGTPYPAQGQGSVTLDPQRRQFVVRVTLLEAEHHAKPQIPSLAHASLQ